MPYIRLGDEDREQLGCPVEWLEFEDRVLTGEAEEFEAYGGALKHFIDRTTVRWWRAMVWLGLYRAGVKKAFDDVQFNLAAVQIEEEPGKAPSSAPDGSRTRRTSASSTRRSTRSK